MVPPCIKDRVRLVGDVVAFIVAESLMMAKYAAELIEIEYEILPSIKSTADAVKKGASLVWENYPKYECFFLKLAIARPHIK